MSYEDYRSDLYYRLYLCKDDKIYVLEMQDFDEYDYDHRRYLRHKGTDEILCFNTEKEAKEFAWNNLKHEHLSDELKSDCSFIGKNDSFYKD